MKRLQHAAVVAAVLLLLVPAAAHAGPEQVSTMQDDALLLYGGDAARDRALDRMRELGADQVRATVLWSVVADGVRRADRRRTASPAVYPRRNWDRFDGLVRAAGRRGLELHLVVTPPGPAWARPRAPSGIRGATARAWKPDPRAFGRFVEAVARRYDGAHRDENGDRSVLPRVGSWSLGSEPNDPSWLAPQSERGRPYAPRHYRELFLRGRAALDRTGHGRDRVLLGETAPRGSSRRAPDAGIRPRPFLRELACRTRRGGGCELFDQLGPLRATGYAHHASPGRRSPDARDPSTDAITTANLGALPALLDGLGNLPDGLSVWVTELGIETDPPDPYAGVALTRQAEWLALADHLAWRQPRVASTAQLLLRDRPAVRGATGRARWAGFQSGLERADGRVKPGLSTWIFPVRAERSGAGQAAVWGQLRFRPNDLPPGAQDAVRIQFRATGSSAFADVGEPVRVTSRLGFFTATVPVPGPGQVRAVWTTADYASPAVTLR